MLFCFKIVYNQRACDERAKGTNKGRDALSEKHSMLFVAKAVKGYARRLDRWFESNLGSQEKA